MQQQLDNHYRDYLNAIFSDTQIEEMIENYALSSPQLLDVEVGRGKYLDSEYKIVFVGKETNGWFNSKERAGAGLEQINKQFDKYISSLKGIYRRFNLGEKYRSPIYLFIDLLVERLSKGKKIGFLLTELLRCDYQCSGLPNELIAKVAYNSNFILRKELETLNPDAVIFLTGPSYDKHIMMTYPMAEFHTHKGYSLNEVSVIENIPSIKNAIRIYHPDYHNRRGPNFKIEMSETIADFLLDKK